MNPDKEIFKSKRFWVFVLTVISAGLAQLLKTEETDLTVYADDLVLLSGLLIGGYTLTDMAHLLRDSAVNIAVLHLKNINDVLEQAENLSINLVEQTIADFFAELDKEDDELPKTS